MHAMEHAGLLLLPFSLSLSLPLLLLLLLLLLLRKHASERSKTHPSHRRVNDRTKKQT
jgi:hypothetical protein